MTTSVEELTFSRDHMILESFIQSSGPVAFPRNPAHFQILVPIQHFPPMKLNEDDLIFGLILSRF